MSEATTASDVSRTARYRPEIFNATNPADAQAIILTPENGTTTAERWARETPFLLDQIGAWIGPTPNALVLDYGCGIGRLSKGVIERFGCSVLGCDIAPNMRVMAHQYVGQPRFSACDPVLLDTFNRSGLGADCALAAWVLQHCLEPMTDVRRIKASLKVGGLLFVINNTHRAVPTDQGWVNDEIDIRALLRAEFETVGEAALPELVSVPDLVRNTFLGLYRKVA